MKILSTVRLCGYFINLTLTLDKIDFSYIWDMEQTIKFLRGGGGGNCPKNSCCSAYFGLICPRKCCMVTKITYMYICFRELLVISLGLKGFETIVQLVVILFHTSSLCDIM